MTSSSDQTTDPSPTPRFARLPQILRIGALGLVGAAMLELTGAWNGRSPFNPRWDEYSYIPAPLVMTGGDPYIRALMRTISASESSDAQPYSLLYGGTHFEDFSEHPNVCVPIVAGPNLGDCTTAAGRYQFITTTWEEQAQNYHPEPSGLWLWERYSFAPEFQDRVVYAWLSDSAAWGVDLATLLRQGQVAEVLAILSPTWTSLGYGIEPNAMTDQLPYIYEEVLADELQSARNE